MLRTPLLLSAAVLLSGCGAPSDAPPEDPRIEAGARLFAELCSECHPRAGRGDFIERIPATLLMRRSEAELIIWIRGRGMHREMPSFDDLSEEQLASLAAFLMSERTH